MHARSSPCMLTPLVSLLTLPVTLLSTLQSLDSVPAFQAPSPHHPHSACGDHPFHCQDVAQLCPHLLTTAMQGIQLLRIWAAYQPWLAHSSGHRTAQPLDVRVPRLLSGFSLLASRSSCPASAHPHPQPRRSPAKGSTRPTPPLAGILPWWLWPVTIDL